LFSRLLPIFLAVVVSSAVAPAAADEFSGERAMHWLRYQCDLGPRTPGSPGIAELRGTILSLADSLGLHRAELCFDRPDPYSDETMRLCNLVVSAGPRDSKHLWLGAHYDTRPMCDLDPDPEKAALPLTGANDAGSGTAVLMHLMELLAADPPDRGVDLIFFDGEDYGRAGDLDGFCLGSRHLAERRGDFGNPLAEGEVEGLIVLDMIGERNVRVPIEQYSLRYARALTEAVFARAAEIGVTALEPVVGPAVFDDHVPFLQQGVPALDLIDFDYPEWHTSRDTPDRCSAESLEQIGRLVLDLIRNPLDPGAGSVR